MGQKNTRSVVEDILSGAYVGPMATIQNNKPHSRYMTFFSDELTLYAATSRKTDKIDEIETNPYTHILLGYESELFDDEFVEYMGEVSIHDSKEIKAQTWRDDMLKWFDGPEDPNLVILKITPLEIRVLNKKDEPPKELEF